MIFVSVGSTKFPFTRLFASVDKIINYRKLSPTLLVQQGNCDYIWQYSNVKKVNYLSPKQLISQIKVADKIIIHAGPATIFLIAKHAKYMPLIVPRLAKLKEHVNDHQLYFAEYLRKKLPTNLKKYFVINEKLDISVSSYLKEKNRRNNLSKFLFIDKNLNKLVKKLDEHISKL